MEQDSHMPPLLSTHPPLLRKEGPLLAAAPSGSRTYNPLHTLFLPLHPPSIFALPLSIPSLSFNSQHVVQAALTAQPE